MKEIQEQKEIIDDNNINITDPIIQDEKLNINYEEELKKLQNELDNMKIHNRELYDSNLRLIAENSNNLKRVTKKFEEQKSYFNEKFLREILPILDSLEEVLKSKTTEEDNEKNSLILGIQATVKIFEQFLEKQNVTTINPINELLDPNKHHVMSKVINDDKENNYITNVLQKGYMLNQRLLRPALVTISQKTEQPKNL